MAVARRAGTVIIGACQGCGACLMTCPEHALRAAPGGPLLLPGRCTGCGECAEVCPVDAITVRRAAARPTHGPVAAAHGPAAAAGKRAPR